MWCIWCIYEMGSSQFLYSLNCGHFRKKRKKKKRKEKRKKRKNKGSKYVFKKNQSEKSMSYHAKIRGVTPSIRVLTSWYNCDELLDFRIHQSLVPQVRLASCRILFHCHWAPETCRGSTIYKHFSHWWGRHIVSSVPVPHILYVGGCTSRGLQTAHIYLQIKPGQRIRWCIN